MLRRTASILAGHEEKLLAQYTSKFVWTPEIRMLDKDEKLPEIPMEQVINHNFFSIAGHSEGAIWPPMDPMNPTKEQRRVANTVQYRMPDRFTSPHHMGFRTIPPELIDWRTTQYGDFLQELPTLNEKTTYSFPDYTLAGLLYTASETKALSDSVPQTVEETPFGRLESPKHAAWNKFNGAAALKNLRTTPTHWLLIFIWVFISYKITQVFFRQYEAAMRQQRIWWDGANAGTWKYAGTRTQYWGQALSGGWVIPVLEW